MHPNLYVVISAPFLLWIEMPGRSETETYVIRTSSGDCSAERESVPFQINWYSRCWPVYRYISIVRYYNHDEYNCGDSQMGKTRHSWQVLLRCEQVQEDSMWILLTVQSELNIFRLASQFNAKKKGHNTRTRQQRWTFCGVKSFTNLKKLDDRNWARQSLALVEPANMVLLTKLFEIMCCIRILWEIAPLLFALDMDVHIPTWHTSKSTHLAWLNFDSFTIPCCECVIIYVSIWLLLGCLMGACLSLWFLQLVKDPRTGFETQNVDAVLRGGAIHNFLIQGLRLESLVEEAAILGFQAKDCMGAKLNDDFRRHWQSHDECMKTLQDFQLRLQEC